MNFKPDLFTFQDGRKVTTAEEWQERRKEILDILSQQEYGITPKTPEKVEGMVYGRDPKCCSGHAVLEDIMIAFDTDRKLFSIPFKFFVPLNKKKNPLILFINFKPDAYDLYFPIEEIIDNGFAFAVVNYQDITTDDGDMRNGLSGGYKRYLDDDTCWGKIGMWAFGASRILDYLETREEVDMKNVAVAGHSRLGKTALWCAAQDERFKFAISNNSGCGGAALEQTKHEGAETIEIMTRAFPFWFCKNYRQYADDHVEKPFDQHFLIAAIAPRYVCVGSASEDDWADQYSEQLACVAASAAWKIQGKRGFVGKEAPAQVGESFQEGDISYHLRDGVHFIGRSDWHQYMTFIKKHLEDEM